MDVTKYRVTYYRGGNVGLGIVVIGDTSTHPTTFADIPAIVAKKENCAIDEIRITSATALSDVQRCPLCGTTADQDGYCVDAGCVNVGKTIAATKETN